MRWATISFLRMLCAHLRRCRWRVPSAYGRRSVGQPLQRQSRELGDIEPGERHRQRFALQPLAMAHRAVAADHVLRHALFHQRALGVREGVQHVASAPVKVPW